MILGVTRLLRAAHPDDPVLDMALTHALLRRVGDGTDTPAARVFVPGPTVAFGRLDALREGFGDAVAAARRHGFVPVMRLGGGHAAAYAGGSLVVELAVGHTAIAEGIEERFAAATALLVEALEAVGTRPVVGERPGEYCPGRWSVHAVGGPKLAGVAQRSVRGASLVTAVVIVEGGARIRAVLTDVYAALGLAWDPATAGALEDVVPADVAGVGAAVLTALEHAAGGVLPSDDDDALLPDARALRPRHEPPETVECRAGRR